MKQLKSWSKSLSAVHIWNIYILSHVLNIMYKPCFLLYIVLCFLQCMIKVASCVILLPFHVFPCPPALIMVLNIHHINLNLYDIPLIIFLFFFCLLCVGFFLQSSNISGVVRTSPFLAWTRFHIFSAICLLGVTRKLRNHMATTSACCRHFLRLLCLFSFTLALCHYLLLQNFSKN